MTSDHVILCLDRGSTSLKFADLDLAVAPPACPATARDRERGLC